MSVRVRPRHSKLMAREEMCTMAKKCESLIKGGERAEIGGQNQIDRREISKKDGDHFK